MIKPDRLSLYTERMFNDFRTEGISAINSAEATLFETAIAMADNPVNQYIVFKRLMDLLKENNESHSKLYEEFSEYVSILDEQINDQQKNIVSEALKARNDLAH